MLAIMFESAVPAPSMVPAVKRTLATAVRSVLNVTAAIRPCDPTYDCDNHPVNVMVPVSFKNEGGDGHEPTSELSVAMFVTASTVGSNARAASTALAPTPPVSTYTEIVNESPTAAVLWAGER
jgi:hypothetical protein